MGEGFTSRPSSPLDRGVAHGVGVGKARVKEKRGEIFTLNILCVSALREVGEAVKAKNEKWLTGARYAREGRHTSPRGAGRPGRRTKKARANDEKTGRRGRKTRNFSTSGGAAGTKAAEHGEPPRADAKKSGRAAAESRRIS